MTYRLSLVSVGLACWLTTSTIASDKVEVLARGPVNEAYAEPAEREPVPTPVIPKEPPKPIEELPPEQKPAGDNVQWMPGYWAWDEDKKDFLWVSGFWRNVPPGKSWVPGSWRKAADGWQWSGGFWTSPNDDKKADVDYLPKPPAPLDTEGATTPQPSENHTYVPGTWVYRDRYVWRPGYWTEHRPGWVWVSAHYRWSPAGYVFIDGYWDYPLAERGVLFAPVYIPPVVYAEPAFVYTPTMVVREECLFGAFFARRGFGSYYFGDYFAASYAGIGFVAWSGHVSASITIGGWSDPLFSYYRCGFRADPFWTVGIGNLYCGRFRGDYLCPPTTLIQQNVVINNITNNNSNSNVNTNNVTMLTSLNNAGRGGRRQMEMVSELERRRAQQAAAGQRNVAERRANVESQLAGRPGGSTSLTTPRKAQLDVPERPVNQKSTLVNPKGSSGGTTAVSRPTAPPPPRPADVGGNVGARPLVNGAKLNPALGGPKSPPLPKTPLANVTPPKPRNGDSTPLPKVDSSNLQRPTPPNVRPETPLRPAPRPLNPPPAAKLNPQPLAKPPVINTPPRPPASTGSPPVRPTPKSSPPAPKAKIPNVAQTLPRPAVSRALAPQVAPRAAVPPARISPPISRPPVVSRPAPAIRQPAPQVRRPSAPPARPAPTRKR